MARRLVTADLLLLAWLAVLLAVKVWRRQAWIFEVQMRPAIVAQICAQLAVYGYLSLNSPLVSAQAPVIEYQGVFAVAIDILIALQRTGRARVGLSAVPIALSINLFIWLRPRFFHAQLAMVAAAILSKHFLTRSIGGERRHVFNPSAIAMAVASMLLLHFGADRKSLLEELIATYHASRPGIYPLVFAVSFLPQVLGRVTLVPLFAFLTLFATSAVARALTGMPAINHWIDPSLLVGVCLLITDPATCPRRPRAQALFGIGYGLGILASYAFLSSRQLHGYYAKILSVPFLNLVAPWLDRRTEDSAVGLRWPPAVAWLMVFSLLLPQIPPHKEMSLLGRLGGEAWAQEGRR
jgi:Na+-translocating ferredoxin:NAD+ oxidoreductase RnfD subunit